jgi:hypothetical protein
MAPEMYDQVPHTLAVDVFSFALILYEVLVGHAAFDRNWSPAVLMKHVIKGKRPEVPRFVNQAVTTITNDAEILTSTSGCR